MKKVARLRMAQPDVSSTAPEPVRTTGRIKKPKAVFDPSDNYLPRAARLSSSTTAAAASTFSAAAAGGCVSPDERRPETPETVSSTQPLSRRQQEKQRLSSRSSGSGGSIGNAPSITSTVRITAVAGGVSPNCVVCFKADNKRNKNKLVNCLECGKKVHKLCLSAEFECLETLRLNYKCDDCRSCCVCEAFSDIESKYNEELVTCTKCVKSYHFTCHIPNVHSFQQNQSEWKCNKCSVTPYPGLARTGSMDAKAIREIMGVGEPPVKIAKSQTSQPESIDIAAAAAEAKTAAAAAVATAATAVAAAAATSSVATTATVKRNAPEQKQNGGGAALSNGAIPKTAAHQSEPKKPKLESFPPVILPSAEMRFSPNELADVPDVKYWSVAQVADYFAKDFPNEAHVFRDQEIDGMSLLLLKRSDVIKKLPIKLGPSLRIYSLILKLQTQLNDPTLGWNCGL